MSGRANPFTPSFGTIPLLFAGRDQIILEILQGLENGPGDPNRISLFMGARGSGKTALMLKISEEAEGQGWISARTTAIPGMLEDIYERTVDASSDLITQKPSSRVVGVGVAGASISREFIEQPQGNWRSRMSALLDELSEHSTGLLITVDEVNISLEELRRLVVTFQHFVGERREVALLMAGLPQNVSAMLHDKTISFLRRAMQHQLGAIHETYEVRETIKKTIELSGRTIQEQALEKVTVATGGFPFLIQLVGYHVWRQNPEQDDISLADADEGIRYALADMDNRIFAVTMRELSENDIRFLRAMLGDTTESKMADLIKRLGVSASYASQYRARLIEQGIIGSRGRGKVGFEMPQFREYLERVLD